MLPLLALGAGAISTGINEYQRQKRRRELNQVFERSRPPSIDFGLRRKNMMSQVAEGRNQQVRGFGEAQAARGVDDAGAAYSAGRAFTTDAARRTDEGMANLQVQEDDYNRAVAEWEARKAGVMAEQPDAWDSLAEGIGTGLSVYQMTNPEKFATQYPQAQPAQGGMMNFRFNPLQGGNQSSLRFNDPRRRLGLRFGGGR